MKQINEYLKEHALLRKLYENAFNDVVDYTDHTYYKGIVPLIGWINEDCPDDKVSYEMIDVLISSALDYDRRNFNFKYNNYWDCIYETLVKSHDYKKLVEYLQKYFGDSFVDYSIIDSNNGDAKSFNIYLRKTTLTRSVHKNIYNHKFGLEIKLDKELTDILNFFNYYFSSSELDLSENGIISILCEPKYSDRVTDIVYNEYGGILYHITHKSNMNNIRRRGLRLRGNSNTYRYIEPRINFFLAHDGKELYERANIIINQKGYSEEDYVILKIDLNRKESNQYNYRTYTIDFYHDNMYKEDWSIYTYGLIHPRLISVLDKNNIINKI